MDPNQNTSGQPLMANYPTAIPPPDQQQPPQNQYQYNQGIPQPQPANPTNYPAPDAYQQVPAPGAYQQVPVPVQPQRMAPKCNPAMFLGVTVSVFCECSSCNQPTHTRVETRPSTIQWLLCFGMALFGFWLCCCIPFCIDSLQSGNHYCSNCGSCIGVISGISI